MKEKKREITDWEKAECLELKALLDAFNLGKSRKDSLTQGKIADRLEISQGAVSAYLNGYNALNARVASVIASMLGCPVERFSPRLAKEIAAMAKAAGAVVSERTGTYAPAQSAASIEANAEIIGGMSGWDSTTPLGDDEVAIPLYKEVELAAGNGATEVIEVPGRLLRFAKSTLREAGVLECNAVCATIKGRSMERLIMDGATIGIDTGTTRIEDGEIYAFDQGGMLRVKYLYRLPGGGVRIRSENDEEFPDETLTAEEFANVRMLGWVFWWSTVRRRRGLSLAK